MSLSSSFKRFIAFIIIFYSGLASLSAINLNVMYVSSCDRKLGIILDVTPQSISLLTLEGKVIKVLRHEIIFFAHYPLTTIPIEEMSLGGTPYENGQLKTVVIKTLVDHQLVDLVEGWPINFSDEKISFLTTQGGEVVVDRDNIWEVNSYDTPKTVIFPTKVKRRYNFVHPYSFKYCAVEYEGNLESEEVQTVFPQQTLSDPVLIKKELDHLEEGHEKILDYQDNQIFYAVPQINSNRVSLGYWFNLGSRYGSATNRSNNTSPLLINEFSDGPFELQQILITGSGPFPNGIHEESQTQLYYRIKGEYLRFAIFWDPSGLFLSNDKYIWQKEELDRLDNRAFENFVLEGGVDFLNYTITYVGSNVTYGARIDDRFINGNMAVELVRFKFRNHFFQTQFTSSIGSFDVNASSETVNDQGQIVSVPHQTKMNYSRFNFEWVGFEKWQPLYSLIYRNFNTAQETATYHSQSLTNAGYLTYQYNKKYSFAGYFSLEIIDKKAEDDNQLFEESNTYLKTGMNVTLSF